MSIAPSGSPRCPGPPRLYQDAIVSVMRFLHLKELAVAAAVQRDWNAAVVVMPPRHFELLCATCTGNTGTEAQELKLARPATELVASRSPLLKHVAALHLHAMHNVLDSESASKLIHLRLLTFVVPLPLVPLPLVFPPNLSHLCLRFQRPSMGIIVLDEGENMRQTLTALQHCKQLHTLELDVRRYDQRLPLRLLSAEHLPSLRSLTMRIRVWFRATLTASHIADIGRFTQLDHFLFVDAEDNQAGLLNGEFLNEQTTVRWKSASTHVSPIALIDEWDRIRFLPSLTALHGSWIGPNLDWLLFLPLLRVLDLSFFSISADAAEALRECEPLMPGLLSCVHLTELTLMDNCPLRSDHLARVMGVMPLLTTLRLFDHATLDSLSFLSAGQLPSTLRRLELHRCRHLAPAEETHIRCLRALRSLDLTDSMQLSAATVSRSQPPSTILPQLEDFHFSADH